ncbi:polysaccharide deacetylase family protein [Aeromicrobium sp.]|uniref:polysaccharide deacetylase family protein n=1 Tax=Aeromicrobium sp. TaxID=1871063 RepID=UPI003C51BDE2
MLRRFLPMSVAVIIICTAAPAAALIPPDTRCRSGEVALTFDDGPSAAQTPKLLKILREHRAQATFFVQGRYATRHPAILRQMIRDGHAVENHSWDHPQLTRRSDRSVRRQLTLTQTAIQKAIGRRPELFRPPYGDTEKRVRTIARRHHLRQQLWTIDTRDWSGLTRSRIRAAALRGLRPHQSNVILMHDNVDNSATTLKAVPSIVSGLRAKGYCLVPLEAMMPLGVVSARDSTVEEGEVESRLVRVSFRMDGPAQRSGSFRVRSFSGSAREGPDFAAVDRRVAIQRGQRTALIHLLVHSDPMPNEAKTMTLRLDRSRGLRIGTRNISVTIADNPKWEAAADALIGPVVRPTATLAP